MVKTSYCVCWGYPPPYTVHLTPESRGGYPPLGTWVTYVPAGVAVVTAGVYPTGTLAVTGTWVGTVIPEVTLTPGPPKRVVVG